MDRQQISELIQVINFLGVQAKRIADALEEFPCSNEPLEMIAGSLSDVSDSLDAVAKAKEDSSG